LLKTKLQNSKIVLFFNFMKRLFLCLFLFSCSKEGLFIPPVQGFNLQSYLGKWHEIARTDNSFERGCTDVTALYTMRENGGITVLNSCTKNGKIKQAKGVGYFKGSREEGELKVSFFRPFYGTYRVIYVDEGYQNAIVYGGSEKYVWILSRSKNLTKEKLEYLLQKIESFGLKKGSLLLQGGPPNPKIKLKNSTLTAGKNL
jgi:apolipoprotein D and lipocalin family protein